MTADSNCIDQAVSIFVRRTVRMAADRRGLRLG